MKLFSESEEQVTEMLNVLKTEREKMNKGDTKIMCNEKARKESMKKGIRVDGEDLEDVEEVQYLGRLVTPSIQMRREIDEKITVGWKSTLLSTATC